MFIDLIFVFRKGYINASDLKCVFLLLGETVSDEEIQSKSSFVSSRLIRVLKVTNANVRICIVVDSYDKDCWDKIKRQNKF